MNKKEELSELEKKKIKEKYIKDFLNKIKFFGSEDRFKFYVIYSKKVNYVLPDPLFDPSNRTEYFLTDDNGDIDWETYSYDTEEAAIDALKEECNYDDMDEEERDEFDSEIDDRIVQMGAWDSWVVQHPLFFLTREEAEEHLQANKHHYNESYTYEHVSWRMGGMEHFLSSLARYFGTVEKGE